jgi:hypothetical protein
MPIIQLKPATDRRFQVKRDIGRARDFQAVALPAGPGGDQHLRAPLKQSDAEQYQARARSTAAAQG